MTSAARPSTRPQPSRRSLPCPPTGWLATRCSTRLDTPTPHTPHTPHTHLTYTSHTTHISHTHTQTSPPSPSHTPHPPHTPLTPPGCAAGRGQHHQERGAARGRHRPSPSDGLTLRPAAAAARACPSRLLAGVVSSGTPPRLQGVQPDANPDPDSDPNPNPIPDPNPSPSPSPSPSPNSNKVYNKTLCSDCGGTVALCKLGRVGAPRPTFWCGACINMGHANCGKRPADESRAAAAAEPQPKRRAPSAWAEDASPLLPLGQKARPKAAPRPPADPASNPWTMAAATARPETRSGLEAAPAPRLQLPPPQALPQAPPQAPPPKLAPPSVLQHGAPPPLPPPPRSAHGIGRVCQLHGPRLVTLRRVRKAGASFGRLFMCCRHKACEHPNPNANSNPKPKPKLKPKPNRI